MSSSWKNGFWSNVDIGEEEGKVVVFAGTKEFVSSNNEIVNKTARRKRHLCLVVTVGWRRLLEVGTVVVVAVAVAELVVVLVVDIDDRNGMIVQIR